MTTGHDVSDARLHRLVGAVSGAGRDVEVLAPGGLGHAPVGARFRSLGARRGGMHRLRTAAAAPFRARGRVILVLDPELVLPGLIARRLRRRRLVVDVHEDYVALLDDRGWARSIAGVAARSLARTSTFFARGADLTVVADSHLPPRSARSRITVRNLPSISDYAVCEPDPEPRAIYIGDVRRSRGLQSMIEAVSGAPPWTLDIVGPVAAEDGKWLEANPVGNQVRTHRRLPVHEAWQLARGAWVGLCLLEDTPAFRAALPTKVYEYLAAGLAIIATPLPRVRAIVDEAEAGIVASTPADVSMILRAWSADPAIVARYRKSARAWAERNLNGPSPFDDLASRIQALVRQEDHPSARESE